MVRWGMIGCGAVTEVKSGPALQKATGSRLVAVMGRNRARAADYAERHGVPAVYDDADRLIADPNVDAVYVATPPGSHLDYALRICAAGKPAYIEKPMARNEAEARRMVEAFAARGVPLFVAYYRRALDRFRKAAELLHGGAIGTVGSVEVRYTGAQQIETERAGAWRVQPEHAGGGVFLDLACHTLDVIDFWFGALTSVEGTATRTGPGVGPEDCVVMSFETQSGVVGTGHFHYATTASSDRIVVHGSGGKLVMSTFGNEPIEVLAQGDTRRYDVPNPPHIQQPLVQTIVSALAGHGTCPSTGASAARTTAVIDRVLASYYRGREDAFWTRPDSWRRSRA